jgi:NADPH2:quinone reductase
MTQIIRVHRHGGPETLQIEDEALAAPGPGEVQIRQGAIGLNFIDVYHRTGLYPPPRLPFTPGLEAAGTVTAVGAGVTGLSPGDRVAYVDVLGAYAQARNVPAARLLALPAQVSEAGAAAMMLKAMTAGYLLFRTYAVKAGETILVHAAAGGVGRILCQWAAHLGATVIGTVGSDEKAEIARANGCQHPVIYTRDDFVQAVRDITDGVGVPVVYDSVGQATFAGSLECLRPFGLLALFGQSSGPVPPFDVGTLAAKGSLYLTRPTLMTHIRNPEDLQSIGRAVFDAVAEGIFQVPVEQEYRLADAARAHADLEARKTTGSSILVP